MAKVAAKKPARTAATKAKAAAKKPSAKAKAPQKAAKPKPPKIDWVATLKSGESGVKKWNALSAFEVSKVRFAGADLSGADLTAARLQYADLRGTDLSGALLNETMVAFAVFDENTKWPADFQPGPTLKWKGKGTDPRKVTTPATTAPALAAVAPVDFGGFMTKLKQVADPAKLSKAAAMLRAEKFQLYAKVTPGDVVGVVKSQTDPDLVYSCRLASDGTYGCGTQNLRQCGGLAGSPCKHLMVLIVGLAKAGTLDATSAHNWTQAARGKRPTFDKDALAATFLDYKGAEAGEVDWRPTETIPEDFYAM